METTSAFGARPVITISTVRPASALRAACILIRPCWPRSRGLYLLQSLTGGHITHGIVDVYPQPVVPAQITLDPNYAHRIIGMDIPVSEMVRILRALEFEVEEGKGEGHSPFPLLRVTAPNHRLDIEGPHDLVEGDRPHLWLRPAAGHADERRVASRTWKSTVGL